MQELSKAADFLRSTEAEVRFGWEMPLTRAASATKGADVMKGQMLDPPVKIVTAARLAIDVRVGWKPDI